MSIDTDRMNTSINRVDAALGRLKDVAQGRVYRVGTEVMLEGKFGVVTHVNKGSTNPAGSTVDVRLADGTAVEKVSVTSVALQLYRQ